MSLRQAIDGLRRLSRNKAPLMNAAIEAAVDEWDRIIDDPGLPRSWKALSKKWLEEKQRWMSAHATDSKLTGPAHKGLLTGRLRDSLVATGALQTTTSILARLEIASGIPTYDGNATTSEAYGRLKGMKGPFMTLEPGSPSRVAIVEGVVNGVRDAIRGD